MVYSAPRADAATIAAIARSKATIAPFRRVMESLAPEVQEVISARIAALSAEAAAQRNRATLAESRLAALRAEGSRR